MTEVNFYDKEQVDDLLDVKADKSDTYTKTEVDTALSGKVDNATLNNYATKTYVDNQPAYEIINLFDLTTDEVRSLLADLNIGDIVVGSLGSASSMRLARMFSVVGVKTASEIQMFGCCIFYNGGTSGRVIANGWQVYTPSTSNLAVYYINGIDASTGVYSESSANIDLSSTIYRRTETMIMKLKQTNTNNRAMSRMMISRSIRDDDDIA